MRLALQVLLISTGVALACGTLVTAAFLLDLESLRSGGLAYVMSVTEVGLVVSVFLAGPLGAIGGVLALGHLRQGATLPRSRWPARGSIVGVIVGALGSAVWPLLKGEIAVAGIYALLGSLAGAIAGAATAALLGASLGPEVMRRTTTMRVS